MSIEKSNTTIVRECQYCGVQFTVPSNSRKAYCSARCRKAAKNRRQWARHIRGTPKPYKRNCPYLLIREYTDTSDMLIAQCLMEGYSIPEIAKLLGRDEQDLKQHIKEAYKNIKLWQKRILQQWGVKAYMRIINARRQKKEGAANERVQI